jgi:hypothetical protein
MGEPPWLEDDDSGLPPDLQEAFSIARSGDRHEKYLLRVNSPLHPEDRRVNGQGLRNQGIFVLELRKLCIDIEIEIVIEIDFW